MKSKAVVDEGTSEVEIVYCRATKCNHNEKSGKCNIVHRVSGDTSISINSEGVCANYLIKT